jgi:hypothetical protein
MFNAKTIYLKKGNTRRSLLLVAPYNKWKTQHSILTSFSYEPYIKLENYP